MTNYERIAGVIDIAREELCNEYGVLNDGRVFKCNGSLEFCGECYFANYMGCKNGMDKWLDKEIDNEAAKSETQVGRGEKVVLNTIRAAKGEKDGVLDTALMGIIAAALVDIKDALTKQNNSLTKEHK